MILSCVQQLNQAVKEVLVKAFHELRSSLVVEDGDEIRPLDEFIGALESRSRAAPVHHLVFDELRTAIQRTDAVAIRRLVSRLEQEGRTPSFGGKGNEGHNGHAELAMSEMAFELGLDLSLDAQWHAANAHLLRDTKELMARTVAEFAHAVDEMLPEVCVFNTLGMSTFDCATLCSARFQGLLFVNRADVTAPLALADILARHAGMSFAMAWLATDPGLFGQAAAKSGKWNSSLALDDASDLLLCATGSAWQAIWEHHLSMSRDSPKADRAQHSANSRRLTRDYVTRMQHLAKSHDLMTELTPLAVLTENMIESAGVPLTTHLPQLNSPT